MSNQDNKLDRREFMAAAGTVTAGLLLVKPETAFGTQANSTIQVGLIGCGGRGSAVTGDFVGRAGCRIAALGDLFGDQLEKARANFDAANQKQGQAAIDPKHLFKGAKACSELCSSAVDVVVIGTPPYYHPDHLEIALQAGKHVYLEKPVATDVRGARKVMDLGRKVGPKQSVHVGFQIRYSPEYREMTRRIQSGAIGDIASVQGYYLASDLPRRPAGASPMETKLRNWFFYKELSGDVLVEQNIHIIDWINWVLQAKPEKAFGTAGRKVRTDIGDVNDHFVTVYKYPNGINVGFQSTQYLTKWADVCVRFMGSKGYAEAHYTGTVAIVGTNEWKAEPPPPSAARQRPEVDPLAEATPEKVKSFIENIKAGKYENQLVQGAESTLSAMLGRQACYQGKELTWDQVFKSNQTWKSDVVVEKLG